MLAVIKKQKDSLSFFSSTVKKCENNTIQNDQNRQIKEKIRQNVNVNVKKFPLICLWRGLDFLGKETLTLYEF